MSKIEKTMNANFVRLNEFLHSIIEGINMMMRLIGSEDRFSIKQCFHDFNEQYRWSVEKDIISKGKTINKITLMLRIFTDLNGQWGAYLHESQLKVNLDLNIWEHLKHLEYESIGVNQEPGKRKLKFELKNDNEVIQLFSVLN
ncbi:hypothetical protein D3C81_1190110 [compost metagenome]